MRVVSGNYVTSKRRGVVEGIDFGSTGTVRFVQHEAIHQQLDLGHVVLLSNLGYSASGEVLNCNTFDVATHAAIELKADKIMCITLDEVQSLRMPQWLSLNDAEALINERLAGVADGTACSINRACPSLNGTSVPRKGPNHQSNGASSSGSYGSNGTPSPTPAQLSNGSSRAQAIHEIELDLDCWQALNFPNALLTAVVGCKSGVKRAHLVDARQDGGLLLELYSRYHYLTWMCNCTPGHLLSCRYFKDATAVLVSAASASTGSPISRHLLLAAVLLLKGLHAHVHAWTPSALCLRLVTPG